MKQQTLAVNGFDAYHMTTRRDRVSLAHGQTCSVVKILLRDRPLLSEGRERTSANVHDSQELPNLLHGNELRLYGDSAYIGQKDVLKHVVPKARDLSSKRASRNAPLTDADKETNRRKSQVRAKVEHLFRPVKSIYGFAKVRYRGLLKNANRAIAMLALSI